MFDKVLFYVSLPIKSRKQKVEINLNEKPYKDIRYYENKPCAMRVSPAFLNFYWVLYKGI